MSVWDKYQAKGDYPPFVSFDQPGQHFAGIFAGLREQQFPNQATTSVIADFSEPWNSVVLGSTALFNLVYEAKPEPGDRVDITLTKITPLGGGKASKDWNVVVTKANGQAPPVQQAQMATVYPPQPMAQPQMAPPQPAMAPPLGTYQPPAPAPQPGPSAPLF